jgi:hypothetical protein
MNRKKVELEQRLQRSSSLHWWDIIPPSEMRVFVIFKSFSRLFLNKNNQLAVRYDKLERSITEGVKIFV